MSSILPLDSEQPESSSSSEEIVISLDPVEVVDFRAEAAKTRLLDDIFKAISDGESYMGGLYGTMFGKKTTAIGQVVETLREKGVNVGFYRLEGDRRYGVDEEHVGTNHRDGNGYHVSFSIDGLYSNLGQLISEDSPQVIVLSEAAFSGPQDNFDDIEKFTRWVRETNRVAVFEGLGWWFNGDPVNRMLKMVEMCDFATGLVAYDQEEKRLASGTLRFDTWIRDQAEGIWRRIDGETNPSINLNEMLEEEKRIQQVLKFCELTGNGFICRVPSHRSDTVFRIGAGESYEPASYHRMKEVYKTFDVEPLDWPANGKDGYNHIPSVRRWDGIKLAS